jgi:hypothetical protein
MPPSQSNDLLAMYFYSMKSLGTILSESKSFHSWKLPLVKPQTVIDNFDLLQNSKAHTQSQDSEFAYLFSKRSASSQNLKIIELIASLPGVDSFRFSSDFDYARHVMYNICKSQNLKLIRESMTISSQFDLQPWEMCIEHLIWTLQNQYTSAQDFIHSAEEFVSYLNITDTLQRLCSIHTTVRFYSLISSKRSHFIIKGSSIKADCILSIYCTFISNVRFKI